MCKKPFQIPLKWGVPPFCSQQSLQVVQGSFSKWENTGHCGKRDETFGVLSVYIFHLSVYICGHRIFSNWKLELMKTVITLVLEEGCFVRVHTDYRLRPFGAGRQRDQGKSVFAHCLWQILRGYWFQFVIGVSWQFILSSRHENIKSDKSNLWNCHSQNWNSLKQETRDGQLLGFGECEISEVCKDAAPDERQK